MLNTILGSLSSGVAASTSSYESIATFTGNGSSNSITFSSIPSTYKHLQIRGILKDSFTSSAGGWNNLVGRFNSDSGSNYAGHVMYGDGSTVTATGVANLTFIPYSFIEYFGNATDIYAANIIDILDYSSTSKYKTVRSFSGFDANNSPAGVVMLGSGLWQSTSAITSITINGTVGGTAFTSGTTFALYGIKGA